MSITHSFLDFIPSVFLGAPDSDTALSILPGHKLLLEGKAYEAVKLTVIGSLGALVFSVLLVPLLIPFIEYIYPFLRRYIAYILILIVVYMILKDNNKFWNFAIIKIRY
jgi:putative membrane protein